MKRLRDFGVRSTEFGVHERTNQGIRERVSPRCLAGLRKHIVIIGILILMVSGCGYELVREKGIKGGEIATLAVPIFNNMTYEPHIAGYFTDSFSKELLGSGLFRISQEGADGTLQGTIRSIRVEPSALRGTGLVSQKDVYIDVELVLTGKNGNPAGRWTFASSQTYTWRTVSEEEYNKREAIRKMSAEIARRFSAVVLIDR